MRHFLFFKWNFIQKNKSYNIEEHTTTTATHILCLFFILVTKTAAVFSPSSSSSLFLYSSVSNKNVLFKKQNDGNN